jgi:two-component system LytT family sensor kinase
LSKGIYYKEKRFGLQLLSGWLMLCLAQVLVLHRLNLSWRVSLIDSLIFISILALSCGLATLIFRYYQPGESNRVYRLIFAVSISALGTALFEFIMPYVITNDAHYYDFLEQSMPLRFIVFLLVLSFVSLLSWMWNTLKTKKTEETQKHENDKLLKEAELLGLQQKLQPHFLFNSLNSISALAASDPHRTRLMVQQLSDFLRGTLRKDERESVKLKEELGNIYLYLEIEKVRFGDRLSVKIESDGKCDEMKVPALILQPLVENAIKFGLYGTTGAITITLKATCIENILQITITNPVDADSSPGAGGTGFGLSFVKRRLFLLFSRNDLLDCFREGETFTTLLKIPQNQ